jgi:hypothetical protein
MEGHLSRHCGRVEIGWNRRHSGYQFHSQNCDLVPLEECQRVVLRLKGGEGRTEGSSLVVRQC